MKDYLKKLWEPISNLSKMHFFITFMVTLVVVVSSTNTLYGTDKEYVPLFQEELIEYDASIIRGILTELHLDYKTGKTGNEILVPATEKSYILLKLSEVKIRPNVKADNPEKVIDQRTLFQGTTKQESDSNYVQNPQEKENLKLDLAKVIKRNNNPTDLNKKLEEAIKLMSPIEDVTVFINPPISLYNKKVPSAVLILVIKPNTPFNENQIKTIRDFVAATVDGLEPNQIEIFDNHVTNMKNE